MEEARKTVDTAMEMVRGCGVKDARIALERATENSATVINGKVDKLLSNTGSTLFIQMYLDGRYGSFSTNMLKGDELRKFIGAAAEATRLIAPDGCRRLPDPAICFHGEKTDLRQYDGSIKDLTMADRIDRAMAASDEIWGTDRKLLSVETEWGDDVEYSYMADTQGFCGETLTSNHTISTNVSIKGRGDEKPESWWYESGIFREDAKVEGCSSKALKRALDQLGPKKIKSGRYNVIIDSTLSSKIVSPVIKALSGGYLQQGNSFLGDSLGKRIFRENLTLMDKPFTPGLSGSRFYDDDGVATKERFIIRDGVIENWFISAYYGLKMNIPVTISGPSVLELKHKQKNNVNLRALLKEVANGILITDFNGGNCNSATGDFSYGIRGFLFENGETVHPIREMNFTGNMIGLWNNLICSGDDRRHCSRWDLPSLAFEGADISGI